MAGRPSDYSPETAQEICAALAEGKSLVAVCREENSPHISTVFRWLAAHSEFRDNYARAREAQADVLAEETVDIADDGSCDYKVKLGDDGPEVAFDSEHVQRSRLRIDARKWYASKLAPKKYGDRVALDHTLSLEDMLDGLAGSAGDAPKAEE